MSTHELLFTVGPVAMDEAVLSIGGKQPPYFRTAEFGTLNLEIASMIKHLVGTSQDSGVVLLTGSGTAAMEATVLNLFSKDEKILVISGGTFGDRFREICIRLGIPHEAVELQPGQDLEWSDLEGYVSQGFTGLLLNACETSTGALYNLPMVGRFCAEAGLMFVVDAISSFLADPYYMDKWGIDATILSSQKGLGLHPGLAIVVLGPRALARSMEIRVPSLYFDFRLYYQDLLRGQTPFTPAVGVLLQLHQRLREIIEVGVDSMVRRTQELANDFRSKLGELPFKIFPESPSNALTALTPMCGISADDICHRLKRDFSIVVNPNGGALKDRVFRVGHLGRLSTRDNSRLIDALRSIARGSV